MTDHGIGPGGNPNCAVGDHDWRYGDECGCGEQKPLVTDHPIPDGLLTRVYVRTGHGSEGQPIVPRFHVDAVLAALAEWADGALIDPNGWRRLDTTEIGDGWFEAGAALEPDFADPPQLRLYTLTERKPVDGPSPVDP